MNDFLWVAKYRPATVDACILPDRLKRPFQEYVDNKSIPNLILTGTPGVGKTTIAKAMCEEIGLDYIVINSSDERGIDVLRTKIKSFATTASFLGTKKVVILDEADGITPDAQNALKAVMEDVVQNCTFILTCNHKSKLIEPIHSRCAIIEFRLNKDEKPRMAAMFFKRLKEILKTEGVEYDEDIIIHLVQKYFPDYRRTLSELQHLSSFGKIDSNLIKSLSSTANIDELGQILKEKDYSKMRKWVVDNSDVDSTQIYRKIYDNLSTILEPNSIPQAVIILSKYQYQAAFVADQEINLVACLTEIMVESTFQ